MPLFANYKAEFSFLPNSMKCCSTGRSSTPPPFHRINPPYPSYYDMKAVELLSLDKVRIHKVYNSLYIITEVDAQDTCLMTTWYLLKVKGKPDDIQKKKTSKSKISHFIQTPAECSSHKLIGFPEYGRLDLPVYEVRHSLQELSLGLKIRVLCFTNLRGCMALNIASV